MRDGAALPRPEDCTTFASFRLFPETSIARISEVVRDVETPVPVLALTRFLHMLKRPTMAFNPRFTDCDTRKTATVSTLRLTSNYKRLEILPITLQVESSLLEFLTIQITGPAERLAPA
jgi:hypothetical protein